MPVSTNFELIYEFDAQKTGRASAPGSYGEWPARIVIKKNFVSGSEDTCTFVPEPQYVPVKYVRGDLLLVNDEGHLLVVGHV